jgi:microcompartment protein CcmL/EutN
MEDAHEESARDIPVEGGKVTLVIQGDVDAHD